MPLTVTTAVCDSFRKESFMGTHLFKAAAGHTFKFLLLKALASGSGTYNQLTTNVGTPGTGAPTTTNVGTDENAGTNYVTGGFTMTPNADPAVDTTNHVAYIDWTTDPSWATATISARAGILYNSSAGNAAVAVWDFGADQTSTAGTFLVQLPVPAYNTALLRIG